MRMLINVNLMHQNSKKVLKIYIYVPQKIKEEETG